MKKGIDYIGVGCGAMIFREDGKVFVAKRGKDARNETGRWDFPGGGVEFGEKCQDALKREIKEEYDFEIEIIELLDVDDHIIKEEGQHWVSPSYIARIISGTPKIMEPDKCEEIRWEDLESIDPETLTITSRNDIARYKEKYGFNPPKIQ